MLAAAAGLVVTILFAARRFGPRAKVAGAVGLIALIIAGGLAIARPKPQSTSAGPSLLRTSSLVDRSSWWGGALGIFSESPLLGTGPDTFYANYPRHRPVDEAARNGFLVPDKPHNVFLEYAAGTGIAGLGTYLALVGLAFVYAFRQRGRLETPERLRLGAFTAMLAAYSAQAIFSIDVPGLAFSGWVALGAIAVLADPYLISRRGSFRQGIDVPGRRKPQAAIALATALLLIAGMAPLSADVLVKTAGLRGDSAASDRLYRRAMRLNPQESSYHHRLGVSLEARAKSEKNLPAKNRLFAASYRSYLEATRLLPQKTSYLTRIAKLTSLWARTGDARQYQLADRSWKRLTALDSNNWQARLLHASLLGSWAFSSGENQLLRRRQADELERALIIKPDEKAGWVQLARAYALSGRTEQAEAALSAFLARPLRPEEKAQLIEAVKL